MSHSVLGVRSACACAVPSACACAVPCTYVCAMAIAIVCKELQVSQGAASSASRHSGLSVPEPVGRHVFDGWKDE